MKNKRSHTQTHTQTQLKGSTTQAGFTLVELLVVIVIAGILFAVAGPSFRALLQGKQLVGQASEVASGFAYARSEAISRSQNVVICASDNGSNCDGDWVDGWIVFVDNNTNNTFDLDDGEELLRSEDKPFGNVTLVAKDAGNEDITSLAFDYEGTLVGGAAVTFHLCAENAESGNVSEGNHSRAILVNTVGSVSIQIGKAICTQ